MVSGDTFHIIIIESSKLIIIYQHTLQAYITWQSGTKQRPQLPQRNQYGNIRLRTMT